MNFSITKDGEPLSKELYTFNKETKTLSTNESGLVLDFSCIDGCTFKTGPDCTFNTGYGCTFKTGPDCTFKTGPDCTFDTGSDCTFDTGSDCTFDTGSGCVLIRRDIFEFLEIPENSKIKLNGFREKGYFYLDEIEIQTKD